MGLFRRKKPEVREINEESFESVLLQAALGREYVTREVAMSIPAVAACVNRICDTVASLDVKLYRKDKDTVVEVEDNRVDLINRDTKDTLTGYQFKRAMVKDMLLSKGGYAFVRRTLAGDVVGLYYVPSYKVSIEHNTDPIIKVYKICIQGNMYDEYSFIKLLRNTENGWSGKSIIDESPLLFEIVAAEQDFEKGYAKRGGVKKGYMQAQSRVSDEAKRALKESYSRMYSNDTENIVVLNEGIQFKEASATSQELQLNDNKITNNDDICKVFGIPPKIITGGATPEDKKLYYEGCIFPILSRFAAALNDVLINPYSEKGLFFAFDDTMLTKADIETRYKAYTLGLKNGFLQLDEVRQKENLPAFGLDFVKLGLQDVLLYPDTGDIYTPNMGVFANIKDKTTNDATSKGANDDSKS